MNEEKEMLRSWNPTALIRNSWVAITINKRLASGKLPLLTLLACLPLVFGKPATALAQSQSPNPYGRFLADSIKVGQEVAFVMTYRHSPNEKVIFPDSTFNFAPFEYLSREFFPTRTDSLISVDSVVYRLTTFELDSVQKLTLPVFKIDKEGKEVPLFAPSELLLLSQQLISKPDSALFYDNTRMLAVEKEFNYPYLIIAVGSLFAIALVVFIVFGRQIRKSFRLRKLRKENNRFILQFDQIIYGTLHAQFIEEGLSRWKAYTAKLTDMPLYSYTTKEIREVLPSESLNQSLKMIDRAIYAGSAEEQLQKSLQELKNYAQQAYEKKVEEIKNG